MGKSAFTSDGGYIRRSERIALDIPAAGMVARIANVAIAHRSRGRGVDRPGCGVVFCMRARTAADKDVASSASRRPRTREVGGQS